VGFGHVLDDLKSEQSPTSVVTLAERAVDDEWRHSEWCRDWALRFGHPGGELRPRSEEPLSFLGASRPEDRLLRIAFCCFTESVGVLTLRHARRVITDPELRKQNQRHLSDELQHSRVGWGHLASLDVEKKAQLARWIPVLLRQLPVACCRTIALDREDLVPYGYFTPRLLRDAHDDALREIILPGLAHLGFRRAA
jgi:hypothetical protein